MRDYGVEAIDLLGDRSSDDLDEDRVLQLALVRLVKVIGEAAPKIAVEFRDRPTGNPVGQLAAR